MKTLTKTKTTQFKLGKMPKSLRNWIKSLWITCRAKRQKKMATIKKTTARLPPAKIRIRTKWMSTAKTWKKTKIQLNYLKSTFWVWMKRLTLKCTETTLIIRLAPRQISKMMGLTQMSLSTSLKSMIRSGCCISNCFFPNAPIPILRRRSIETWRHTSTPNSSRSWKSLVKL